MSIAKLEHEIAVPSRAPDGSRHLRVVHGRQGVNLPAAERAVRDLLVALGRDPSSPHLADTPLRVAKSLTEMLTPREFDLTTFPNDEHYDELVLARSIPVQSLCEHHMLPFTGVAHVGLPAGRTHPRPVEAGPRCRAVRPRPSGAGTSDGPGGELASGEPRPQGSRCRD
jgi:GTP cyclohydrolase I